MDGPSGSTTMMRHAATLERVFWLALLGCSAVAGCALSGDYDFSGHELDGARTDPVPCKPLTCQDFDAHCGTLSDGCGRLLSCGTCEAPATCGGGGTSYRCGCRRITCEEAGATCGRIDDGCGKERDCGRCARGLQCGQRHPNQCAPRASSDDEDDD
jgi:hypothetical protein